MIIMIYCHRHAGDGVPAFHMINEVMCSVKAALGVQLASVKDGDLTTMDHPQGPHGQVH